MNEENLIHVKFEYDESIKAKKDILSSEVGLLQIAKAIRNHRALRTQELKSKEMFVKKLKELKFNLTKLQQILPTIRIPKILQPKEKINKEESFDKKNIEMPKIKTHHIKDEYHDDLEIQLQEIQERLRQLGN